MSRQAPLIPLRPRMDSFAPTHGFLSANHNGVGIVDDSVAYGIGKGWFSDFVIPASHLELRAEYGGSLLVPRLHDFQYVAGFGFFRREQQPFIQNQKANLLVFVDNLMKSPVTPADCEFAHQIRNSHIFHGMPTEM